jgi:hypothetical protein
MIFWKGWREMKRLLFVLLMLGISLPAIADVLVYNVTQAEIEMQNNSNVWSQVKGNYKDYFVIEPQTNGTANVWSIMTYKAKDSSGKMQNYYTTQNMGALTLLQVQVGTKQQWILTGASGQINITLNGNWIPGKKAPGDHGNGPLCSTCHSGRPDRATTPASAPSMAGSSMWDQTSGTNRSIGSAKITMKMDTKTTALVAKNSYTSSDTVNYLVGTLTAKGYVQGT